LKVLLKTSKNTFEKGHFFWFVFFGHTKKMNATITEKPIGSKRAP